MSFIVQLSVFGWRRDRMTVKRRGRRGLTGSLVGTCHKGSVYTKPARARAATVPLKYGVDFQHENMERFKDKSA